MSLLDDELEHYKSKAKWFWAERGAYLIAIVAAFVVGTML